MRTRMCHYRILPYDSLSTTTHPSETASCSYLSDGTKITAKLTGEDETQYRGSVIYLKESSGFSSTFETVSMPGGGMVFVFQHDMDTICLREGHLGSVRTIVNASGTVVEQNDYYPFGSRTTCGASNATLASNRQRFSGREDQTAVAGSTLPYLDFGARMYDAKLVRWNTYDPMAEKYYGINPYAYCNGDPVNMVDPLGRKLVIASSNYQEVPYSVGMKYSGDDSFVANTVSALNAIIENGGKKAINRLIDSQMKFVYDN